MGDEEEGEGGRPLACRRRHGSRSGRGRGGVAKLEPEVEQAKGFVKRRGFSDGGGREEEAREI